MATGTIRIIRDETRGVGGVPEQVTGGITITPDPPGNSATTSVPTAQQSGSGTTTQRKRRQSDAKRTSLSVEDRDGAPSSEVKSRVQPGRTTPAPTSGADNRIYRRQGRPRYMGVTESEQTAQFLLSAVEMVGVTAAGTVGEMTDFERGLLTPPLKRVLQRTPVGIIEKTTPLIDLAFLVMGGALYFNRVSGGIKFPSKPKTKGTQEDTAAPQAAPVENTVVRTSGDKDGLATPIPTAISSVLNGAV